MRFVEITQCSFCPWLCGELEFSCNNPDEFDREITDITGMPSWCPLDELLDVEEDDD